MSVALTPSGCRAGHSEHPSPVEHPELGVVPSRSSAVLGAFVLALVCGLLWWFFPAVRGWLLAVVGVWWALTLAVQLALGHRGSCLVRRTLRWFFGPAGGLLDPFEGA